MKKITVLLLALLVLFGFAACSKKPPKESYIKASSEAQCFAIENPESFSTQEGALDKVKGIFGEYGFPVDDTEAMNKITDEFNEDQSVRDAITAEVEKCLTESK